MHIRPYLGTVWGAGLGVLAVAIWMLTFQPHGGFELSRYLFPFSAFILEHIYPDQAIPVPLWYCGAVLQWTVIGAIVDLLRNIFRKKVQS
jgi:hypothetical protein